jgi:hypothetical protein
VVAKDVVAMIRTAIIAAAGAALVAGLYSIGYRAGSNAVGYEWEKDKLARTQSLLAQEAAHRATERKWGDALAQIIDAERAAQEATRHELESIIADRESGALRLRSDLRGCRANLPADTQATGSDHGGNTGGLSRERQGVALRIFRDADDVYHRLTMCREYVRAIQAAP